MMRPILRFLRHLLFWAALAPAGISAQDLPEPMSPRRLVNDFAGLLSDSQRQALERKLADFDRETSTQIAVVTIDDLGDYAPSDFAQRLHDKWGVGREGKNNGILVLVKPSVSGSRGEAYISVGYGLEGVIPDITAGRILDNEMIPRFREGDIYGGSTDGRCAGCSFAESSRPSNTTNGVGTSRCRGAVRSDSSDSFMILAGRRGGRGEDRAAAGRRLILDHSRRRIAPRRRWLRPGGFGGFGGGLPEAEGPGVRGSAFAVSLGKIFVYCG
ncbi:MAG: TPM domain-containing protein [Alistipes sp.]